MPPGDSVALLTLLRAIAGCDMPLTSPISLPTAISFVAHLSHRHFATMPPLILPATGFLRQPPRQPLFSTFQPPAAASHLAATPYSTHSRRHAAATIA